MFQAVMQTKLKKLTRRYKLSLISDAVLVHNIPEANDSHDSGSEDTAEKKTSREGDWYAGRVYYAFKSMVFEGSTSARGVVELGKVLDKEYEGVERLIPNRFYLITDGGGDRNVTHLSVQKSLIGFFLKYDFDEVIAIRTAAGLSFYNPVERMHARTNQGLQSLGIMRKAMEPKQERVLKKYNSNEEVRNACGKDLELSAALKDSLQPTIDLLKEIIPRLSMSNTEFELYEPATDEEMDLFSNFYATVK